MAWMMKAFVMEGIGEVVFLDKPVPEPSPNDAIVKTTRALSCTSDIHTLRGGIGERKRHLTLGRKAVGVSPDWAEKSRASGRGIDGERVGCGGPPPPPPPMPGSDAQDFFDVLTPTGVMS